MRGGQRQCDNSGENSRGKVQNVVTDSSAAKEGLAVPREAPDAELAHFELVNKDGVWWPAHAQIDGKTVVVRNAKARSPVAVRYAYAVTPENCNLYSRDGLPASPFCSDPSLLQYDPGLPK